MPRAKKVVTDTQVYKLAAYGAVVTIEYDVSNPPPFFQPGPGVVIVGEHACQPVAVAPAASAKSVQAAAPSEPQPFASNFEVDENDPKWLEFKARHAPAPPDLSKPVITNDDINREFEQRIKQETGFDVSVPNASGIVAVSG